ncbi:hypothetical protein [Devosia sp. RR2S18]|uniref:hypothetical protein n=1 Tax=Devosia rhizosphaerae TaxID=3049774 RepID=UPI0025419633|nr:hypothetical protein [Devosia sp. RR2S18]WIJ23937.1 hypothetical protein QOV41_12910 [Devosia sp. RR2S18]
MTATSQDKRSDLHETKLGVAVLATCIIEAADETDPGFKERVLHKMGVVYQKLRDQSDGNQIEQMELLDWTRSLLSGFEDIAAPGASINE